MVFGHTLGRETGLLELGRMENRTKGLRAPDILHTRLFQQLTAQVLTTKLKTIKNTQKHRKNNWNTNKLATFTKKPCTTPIQEIQA